MIRRPPRSTQSRSSAASDVYKRQRSSGRDSRSKTSRRRHSHRNRRSRYHRKWTTEGGRSITVRERLLLPAAETRLEGGGGGNRSYVGLPMQIRGSRAQPETGGPSLGA